MSQFMTRILLLGGAQFCTGRGRHTQRFNQLQSILQSKYNSNPYAFPKRFFFNSKHTFIRDWNCLLCSRSRFGDRFPKQKNFLYLCDGTEGKFYCTESWQALYNFWCYVLVLLITAWWRTIQLCYTDPLETPNWDHSFSFMGPWSWFFLVLMHITLKSDKTGLGHSDNGPHDANHFISFDIALHIF